MTVLAVLIVSAYLLGSVSTAIVVCKLLGVADPRKVGSGNPGATNVLRHAGKTAAAATLLGDVGKGVIAVAAGHALGIATPSRDGRVPKVPTMGELGVDLVFGLDRGVMLPKGTPADVVAHYEAMFLKVMKDPGLKKTLEAKGNSIITQGSADYRGHLEKTFETLKSAAIKVGLFKK